MEELVFFYSEGQKIFGNLHVPRRGTPCVLMSHGFESSKDGTKWRILASRFSDAGFATLRFSYRGCGEGSEKSEGTFEGALLSKRVKDYVAAIEYLRDINVGTDRLGVIGSSFGGMTALAAKDNSVRAMVVLSTPCRFSMPAGGNVTSSESASAAGQFAGMIADARKFDICASIREMDCPLLIIHTRGDNVVSVENAYEIYANAREPKKLEIIDGADHLFAGTERLERAIDLSTDWFKTYL